MKNQFNIQSNPCAPIYGEEIWKDAGVLKTFEDKTVRYLQKKHPQLMKSFMNKENTGYSIPRNLATFFHICPFEFISDYLKINIDDVIKFSEDIKKSCNYVQYSTNCYQYALNDTTIHSPGCSTSPNGINFIENNSLEHLIKNVIADGAINAGKSLPPIKEGYYRIALLYLDEKTKDYHFARENQSTQGTVWSHKEGTYTPLCYDDNGKIITNIEDFKFRKYEIENYFHIKQGGLKTKPIPIPN